MKTTVRIRKEHATEPGYSVGVKLTGSEVIVCLE